MRLLFKVSLVLAVAALVASSALAQGRPGGGFGQMGLGQLLANKSVQEELKLTDEQKTKIKEASDKYREENKADYDKLRSRDTKPEERAELTKKLSDGQAKVLTDLVKPEQMKRAKQIMLQQQMRFGGVTVLVSEDMQKELKLTDDQKDKIKTLADDLRKDREKIRQDAGMDMAKLREAFTKMQEMTKEATEKATKLLTDDQKKTLKDLQGEPFEIKIERPGGAGGGGADRPGRPGGTTPPPKKIDF